MKAITEETRAAMVEAIEVHRDFLVGNDSPEDVAEEWLAHGFLPDTAGPWWLAGCFNASGAARCDNAGLTPDDLSKPSDHPGMSVGYAVCNRDMTVEDALRRT